jgi:hypothetical protein
MILLGMTVHFKRHVCYLASAGAGVRATDSVGRRVPEEARAALRVSQHGHEELPESRRDECNAYNIFHMTISINNTIYRHMCRYVSGWCPGQNKRIAPLPFFQECRKRRLKDL